MSSLREIPKRADSSIFTRIVFGPPFGRKGLALPLWNIETDVAAFFKFLLVPKVSFADLVVAAVQILSHGLIWPCSVFHCQKVNTILLASFRFI
jgi:hypothetical protein